MDLDFIIVESETKSLNDFFKDVVYLEMRDLEGSQNPPIGEL